MPEEDEEYKLKQFGSGRYILYTFYVYGDYDEAEIMDYDIIPYIQGYLEMKIQQEINKAVRELFIQADENKFHNESN